MVNASSSIAVWDYPDRNLFLLFLSVLTNNGQNLFNLDKRAVLTVPLPWVFHFVQNSRRSIVIYVDAAAGNSQNCCSQLFQHLWFIPITHSRESWALRQSCLHILFKYRAKISVSRPNLLWNIISISIKLVQLTIERKHHELVSRKRYFFLSRHFLNRRLLDLLSL